MISIKSFSFLRREVRKSRKEKHDNLFSILTLSVNKIQKSNNMSYEMNHNDKTVS